MSYPTKKLEANIEDKSKDARILFSILTGRNAHIITIIVVGHLLTRHLLDKIIVAKLKGSYRIPKERFSEKLRLLYPDWLPSSVYRNIKLLNGARNDIAHNLGATSYEPIIYTSQGSRKILNIPKRKNKEKFYFRELINIILFDLVNYSFYSLNISNKPDLNIIFCLKR